MVRIAERVWSAWREAGEDGTPAVMLRLSSSTIERAETVRAVRESVSQIVDAHLAEVLREALADERDGRLTASTDDGERSVGVGSVGTVGLAICGAALDAGGWHPALDELTGLMREIGELLAYGYVRRAAHFGVFGDSLDRDWPARPNPRPRGGGVTDEASRTCSRLTRSPCSCSVRAMPVGGQIRRVTAGCGSAKTRSCSNIAI